MFTSKRKKLRQEFENGSGSIKREDFNFYHIKRYFFQKKNDKHYHLISDRTCDDLDFDDLFIFLDRTTSKIGQQYLYAKLRILEAPLIDFKLQEEIIEKLKLNKETRFSLFKALKGLANHKAYSISTLLLDRTVHKPKWYFVIPILSIFSLLVLVLSIANLKFLFAFIGMYTVNSIIHYWNKRNLYAYLDSVPQLSNLIDCTKDILKKSEFSAFGEQYKSDIKSLEDIKIRMQLLKIESKMDSDFAFLGWAISELLKAAFLLEPILLFGIIAKLERRKDSIREIFDFVGWVDTCLSIYHTRQQEACCIPNFVENDKHLEFQNLYHPLVMNCVPNSLSIKQKSILLTGSNMSGKTTFIRAIGVNIISSMSLNTAFASSFKLPPLKLHSAIRINDDLFNDKSYFLQEVLTIQDMISESDQDNNIFLLDEIFKGTNTIERIASGKAVLSYLNRSNNLTFVSTHDLELTDLLKDEYDLYHFSENIENNKIQFDYKLKEGELLNKNAIRILELNQFPNELIGEAKTISNSLNKRE